ncbi:MAG: hypothetical protein WBH03_11815, partial [Cyclobacteriaceae bacterium]
MKPLYVYIILLLVCGPPSYGFQQTSLSELSTTVQPPDTLFVLPDKEIKRKVDSVSQLSSQVKAFNVQSALPETDKFNTPAPPPLDVLSTSKLELDDNKSLEALLEEQVSDLKVKEKRISDSQKVIVLKERESLLDRAFFEGVINVLNTGDDIRVTNLSPSLGFELTPGLSIGAGPSVSIAEGNTILGGRAFIKAQAIKSAYIQLEDNYSGVYNQEGQSGSRHNPMIGAGYVFSITSKIGLN